MTFKDQAKEVLDVLVLELREGYDITAPGLALSALEEAHKASELATLQRIYNYDTWPEVEMALELRIEELKGESNEK